MNETVPPVRYSPQASIEYRVRANYAERQKTAFAKPPQKGEPVMPDYAGMHRAEIMVLTQRQAVQRTQARCDHTRAGSLMARIMADPERMEDSRLRFAIPDAPMPPTIAETAGFTARMEHCVERMPRHKTYRPNISPL